MCSLLICGPLSGVFFLLLSSSSSFYSGVLPWKNLQLDKLALKSQQHYFQLCDLGRFKWALRASLTHQCHRDKNLSLVVRRKWDKDIGKHCALCMNSINVASYYTGGQWGTKRWEDLPRYRARVHQWKSRSAPCTFHLLLRSLRARLSFLLRSQVPQAISLISNLVSILLKPFPPLSGRLEIGEENVRMTHSSSWGF